MKGSAHPTPPDRFAATLPIEGREGGKSSIARARSLRQKLTGPEAKLWTHLKRIKVADTHFRKQVPFGPYVVDFACLRGRLIVEVDGSQHGFDVNRSHDLGRTEFLERQGFRVLRFWNDEVLREMEQVLDTIYAHLHGAVDAPARLMSRRKALRDDAPSSPSMGEVSPKATEGVTFGGGTD